MLCRLCSSELLHASILAALLQICNVGTNVELIGTAVVLLPVCVTRGPVCGPTRNAGKGFVANCKNMCNSIKWTMTTDKDITFKKPKKHHHNNINDYERIGSSTF